MKKREMRTKDCLITNKEEIQTILDHCERCRLGFSEDGVPYVIPMNYGYTFENDVLTLFFHGASEGRKIDIIRKNPLVCFEIDCDYRLNPDASPQRHAVKWESIVGTGTIEYVTDFNEKRMILGNMMRKFRRYNPLYRPNPLTDDRVIHVTIWKLVLDEFQAKRVKHI